MSDLNISFDGLEILFKPVKGKEAGFYADAADVPPIKTIYDKDKKQITLEVGTVHLGKSLKNLDKVITDNNQYISSYEITQKSNKTQLVVNLRDSAKRYLIKIKRLPKGSTSDGFPYISVEFAGEE